MSASTSLPPRDDHIATIRHHFQLPHTPPLYLHGSPNTGRLATLHAACPLPSHSTSHIDCVLSHSDRTLLGAATKNTPCDAPTFLQRLRTSPIKVLVLHRAERLATGAFSGALLAVLFSAGKLAKRPDLVVVLLSNLPWTMFRRKLGSGLRAPVEVTFVPYSEEEVVGVIVDGMEKRGALLKGFAEMVVQVLYASTTDVAELKYVTESLFGEYESEFQRIEGRAAASVAAFHKVAERLGGVLRGLYLREYVSTEELLNEERGRRGREEERERKGLSSSAVTLLVAAYLASVNPAKQDVRYFTVERTRRIRGGGRGRGKGRAIGKGGRAEKAEGAHVFPLERWLAIYDAIREDDRFGGEVGVVEAVSTSLLIQISTLVSLGYLSKEGGDLLGEPKFQCNLTAKQAAEFAHMAGVELPRYLHRDTN